MIRPNRGPVVLIIFNTIHSYHDLWSSHDSVISQWLYSVWMIKLRDLNVLKTAMSSSLIVLQSLRAVGVLSKVGSHQGSLPRTSRISSQMLIKLFRRRRLHPHKSSECRLLAWVAVDRNAHPWVNTAQRCTCPMSGCGLQFSSPEFMHMHLKTSSCLSKSTYHCLEIGKEVRIGKCDSSGCQELKGRLVSAMSSSIESVKRRLSGRRSNTPPSSLACSHEIVNSAETSLREFMPLSEMSSSNQAHLLELETPVGNISQVRYEIDDRHPPIELCSTPKFRHETDSLSQETFPSVQSSDNQESLWFQQDNKHTFPSLEAQSAIDSVHYTAPGSRNNPSQSMIHATSGSTARPWSIGTDYRQTKPVELSADRNRSRGYQSGQVLSKWSLSSACNSQGCQQSYPGSQVNNCCRMGSSTYRDQDVYSHTQHAVPYPYHSDFSEKMVVEDFTNLSNVDDMSFVRHSPRSSSTSNSSTGSDLSLVTSMFSRGSGTSTRQSSFGSGNSASVVYDQSPFLKEDSTMFEEPESMEEPLASTYYGQEYNDVHQDLGLLDPAGVSIDNYVTPGCYLSDSNLHR